MEAHNERARKKVTLTSVGAQGKPESVCATLWDAIGVVGRLALLRLLHLQRIQVAVQKQGMKTLEGGGEREGHHLQKNMCSMVFSFHLSHCLVLKRTGRSF